MKASDLDQLAQTLGYPTVAHIPGFVLNPFATGTFAITPGVNTIIDLADPTVWADDVLASNELRTTGTEADFGIYAQGVCLEFIGDAAVSASTVEIANARESLYVEVQDGIATRRIRCGLSVAGKPTAADLATAANQIWFDRSEREYPEDSFAVNLRDIKSCRLMSDLATASGLPTQVRLHVMGFLMSTSGSASVSCVKNAAKAARQVGMQRTLRLK